MASGVLSGVRILEIGDELTQYAGKLLADLGAEVIKVEPPGGVDARKVGPFYKDEPGMNNSLYYWHYNTSKKSVTIDLTKEDGQQLLRELITEFDVLIEDGKPGFMKNIGLGEEVLCKINPGLVYCSVTPFGQEGPWSQYKSSDLIQLALGGIMAVCGYDDVEDAPPVAPTGGQSAHLAGYFTAIAITGALFHRDFTSGKGQYIDMSVHDCVTVSTEMSIPFWEYQQAHVHRQTGRHALANKSNRWIFKCKDGRYILSLNTYINKDRWIQLVDWLVSHGAQEDLEDERYADDFYRGPRMNHVCEILERFCSQQDSEYLYRHAQSIGLPWAPVRAPEEMATDPHFVEDRGSFVEVHHPELGETFTYPGAPFIFSENSWEITSRAPLLGEHNRELGKWVKDPSKINLYREIGVI